MKKLLDDLTASLIQNLKDNTARLEGASNQKVDFIDNIYMLNCNKPLFCKTFCTYTKKIS